MAFQGPQHTSDAIRQKIVVVENICLFCKLQLSVYYKQMLQS